MAISRGATTAPLVGPEKPTVNLGSAPVRYRAKPVQGEPAADQLRAAARSADQGRRCGRRRGAAADSMRPSCRSKPAPKPASASPSSIMCSGSTSTRAASPTPGARARRGEWAAQAAWVSGLASWRLGDYNAASAAFQQVAPARAAARASRRRLLLGGARRAGGRPAALGRSRCCARRAESAGKLLRPRSRAKRSACDTKLPADPLPAYDPPVDQLPNVQRATELARIGEPACAEEMLRHQAKIGLADRASCADPARQAARPPRRAAVARQQRPAGRPVRRRRPLSQSALEPARTAGGSIPPSPSAISSRNPRSAAPRSAPPARSG